MCTWYIHVSIQQLLKKCIAIYDQQFAERIGQRFLNIIPYTTTMLLDMFYGVIVESVDGRMLQVMQFISVCQNGRVFRVGKMHLLAQV